MSSGPCFTVRVGWLCGERQAWVDRFLENGKAWHLRKGVLCRPPDRMLPHPMHCALQPPELLTEGLLTAAADVYSYGVVLW